MDDRAGSGPVTSPTATAAPRVRIVCSHGVAVVRLRGRFGMLQTHLIEDALAEAGRRSPAVVVDLSGMQLLDAALARTLRRAHAAAERGGSRFIAAGADGQPLRVLDALGLTKQLGAHLPVAEAMELAADASTGRERTSLDAAVHRLLQSATALPAGDPHRAEIVDQAITTALPLARTMALRYQRRGESLEDLVQVASIGVIRAVHDYQPDRGSGFLAYAVPTVLGELRRHLRDHLGAVRAPRRLQELRTEMAQNSSHLVQALGHEPTIGDIAAHLGVAAAEVAAAVLTDAGRYPVSLDAPVSGEAQRTLHDMVGATDPDIDLIDLRQSLARLIAGLPPDARELLRLRFGEELTQSQIATRLNTSQMSVSRRLTVVLTRLRHGLLAGS